MGKNFVPTVQSLSIRGKDRLDKELCEALHISRETSKQLIRSGRVRIAGRTRHHPARRLRGPTDIEILPAPEKSPAPEISTASFDVQIIYEDDAFLALNKPSGLAVHPGVGHENDTLVDWLKARRVKLARTSDPGRAGLVHRLDKDTSGLILVAKESSAAEHLMRQFAERKIAKEYQAVVQGRPPSRPLKIVGAIGRSSEDRKKFGIQRGGREAVTVIECLAESKTANASLIRVAPLTGRTHQIRVHLKYAGFPILGDPLYGKRNVPGVPRMLLHASEIRFAHPVTGAAMRFVAPLPEDFRAALGALGIFAG